MRIIKKFDDWKPNENIVGSGQGKKVWLMNSSDDNEGWFKYVKTRKEIKNNQEIELPNTYENISEKLAELIAIEIGIKNAHIDVGTYKGELGCLSYNIRKNQNMIEGLILITKKYPKYNPEKLYDENSKKYYSIEMILNSLETQDLKNEFLKVMIFDYIIGNSDRHHSNWAVIINKDKNIQSLAPLYDNGSSLCAFISEEKIDDYINTKDMLKLESLVISKSRSIIRIDAYNKTLPKHLEIIQYLCNNFYIETNVYVKKVVNILNSDKIDVLVNSLADISYKRKKLLKIFLKRKILDLDNIYKSR